ncbi:MAG: JAB domain-containing protein [Planctomycetaceae bacterium]|nr:JAB domain-containing protein [Planctomycetaceae bacterium]
MLRQLELWAERESPETLAGNATVSHITSELQQRGQTLLHDQTLYTSLKRVSLVHEGSLMGRPQLTSTEESKAFFRNYWKDNPAHDQEKFVVACLDTKNRVQCVVVVTIGTLDASLVHPREVFKPAIIEGASAVVLSHNHPSGDTTPSREDHTVTDRLTEAGKLLGITVLDHIIHGDGTGHVCSIREAS